MLPAIERAMSPALDETTQPLIVIDFTNVHRLETAAVQFFDRKIREYASNPCSITVSLAGVVQDSGVHADLLRGGIVCNWKDYTTSQDIGLEQLEMQTRQQEGVPTFPTLSAALRWVKSLDKGE